MIRNIALALAFFATIAALPTEARVLETIGTIQNIQYSYGTNGKLRSFSVQLLNVGGNIISLTFNANSGSDIKDHRSLGHAMATFETISKGFMTLRFVQIVSGNGGCSLGSGTCPSSLTLGSTAEFAVTALF